MKTSYIMSVALATLLSFSGCESSSDSATNEEKNTTVNTQEDAVEAAQAINLMLYTRSVMQEASDSNITIAVASTSASPKRGVSTSETLSCAVSGSVSVDVDVSLSNTIYSATFDNCVESVSTVNGALSATVENTQSSSEIAFNNFSVDNEYATLIANFTSKQSGILGTTSALDATLDGKMSYTNKAIASQGYMQYDTFKANIETTSTQSQMQYSGDITIEDSLLPCISGLYSIKTLETIVTSTATPTLIESGSIEINEAVFTFNSGTITVTTSDGEAYTIAQDAEPTCSN